jgi:flagellar hook protein FlgE
MDLSAIALSGLQAAGAAVERAGRRVTAATSPESAADTVDLSTAMVGLLASQRQFEANLKVFQTADEMDRHTIDVLG